MEIEFKFHIPPERLEAVRADLCAAPFKQTRLQARYFDTANGLLAAHGAVLRLRKEGTRWVQTAKALGDGPLHRLEHNADLGPARAADSPPLPDVRRHAGTPVGERLAALLATSKEPLVETYGTDIQRLSRIVGVPRADGAGETTVELALDVGHVTARGAGSADGTGDTGDTGAARTSAVCELELELAQGEVAGLVELARRWSRRHGLWFDTVSKAERGERLMAGRETGPAIKATPPRFGAFTGRGKRARREGPDGPAVQRAVVAACLAQVLPNASELAAGNDAGDVMHQLRVGIRRLRTALRELEPLGPGFDPAWEAPLVDAFRALGARRDEELMANELGPRLAAAGAPPIDLAARAADVPGDTGATPSLSPSSSPGDIVRAPAFQAVLVELIGFTAVPPPSGPTLGDGVGEPGADRSRAVADATRAHPGGRPTLRPPRRQGPPCGPQAPEAPALPGGVRRPTVRRGPGAALSRTAGAGAGRLGQGQRRGHRPGRLPRRRAARPEGVVRRRLAERARGRHGRGERQGAAPALEGAEVLASRQRRRFRLTRRSPLVRLARSPGYLR
jgi:hypothetical protein